MGVAIRVQQAGMTEGIRKCAARALHAGPSCAMRRLGRAQATLSDRGGRRDDEGRDCPIVAELLPRAGREGRRIAQNSSRLLGSRFAV